VDPMEFLKGPKRKVNADYFTTASTYVEFIKHNPYIDIINVVTLPSGNIVLTYKEAL
jgi:hypothetical protein